MLYHTSTSHLQRPWHTSFLAIASWPWQMLARRMIERRDYAQLSSLDDHLLKDIGISRGNIRSAIREGRKRH